MYLDPRYQARVQQEFEESSEICLPSFLQVSRDHYYQLHKNAQLYLIYSSTHAYIHQSLAMHPMSKTHLYMLKNCIY